MHSKPASCVPRSLQESDTRMNINNIKCKKKQNLLLYCKGKNCEQVDWKRQWHLYRDRENS